ncbi:MAG TPA: Ig-like domain-containing protein [Gemmatimonadales bacterium]
MLVIACANIQPPPGGPPDKTPPTLTSTYPDSMTMPSDFRGNVEFRFNEVVSEGSSPSMGLGTGDLEKLIILSPTDKTPDVGWHRRRITVRPAEGWKPNRVYRVELLPGVADVRQNKSNIDAVVTFTTGAPVPHDSIRGRMFDWKAGTPAILALVEAVLEPDSLPYRALTDSTGRFAFGPLPHGEYLVFGVVDANHNFRRDLRESFDSVRIRPESATTEVPELYAFVHDTLPPRLVEATSSDSVTASLSFATSLDPFQKLDTSAVSVRKLPDSVAVAVVLLAFRDTTTPRRADTVAFHPPDSTRLRHADTPRGRRPVAPGDTAAMRLGPLRLDTTAAGRGMHRPQLTERMVLKVGEPWHPGDKFLIQLTGIRTVSGTSGDPRGVLAIPEPKAAPGPPSAADSARADSIRKVITADSLRHKGRRRR